MLEIWQAFQDLNNSRTVGFCVNPIQVSEIKAWLDIHEVSETEDKAEYFRLIKALDAVWSNWSQKKQKEKHEADKKKKG